MGASNGISVRFQSAIYRLRACVITIDLCLSMVSSRSFSGTSDRSHIPTRIMNVSSSWSIAKSAIASVLGRSASRPHQSAAPPPSLMSTVDCPCGHRCCSTTGSQSSASISASCTASGLIRLITGSRAWLSSHLLYQVVVEPQCLVERHALCVIHTFDPCSQPPCDVVTILASSSSPGLCGLLEFLLRKLLRLVHADTEPLLGDRPDIDSSQRVRVAQHAHVHLTRRRADSRVGQHQGSFEPPFVRPRPGRVHHRAVQGRGDSPRGPWRGPEAVELATLDRVDWFNHRRALEPIGNRSPAEAEAAYYRQSEHTALAA